MKPVATILRTAIFCAVVLFTSKTSFSQVTIVPYGSVWKYWANSQANAPAATWNTVAFNDAAWTSAATELGYGDGDEANCIASGGGGTLCTPTGNKWATYYFRKVVNVPDKSLYSNFTFNVERDDGFVVYVNGVEVGRNNMPVGAVTYATAASSAIEDAVVAVTVPTSAFVNGDNTIAVEMHQSPVAGAPNATSTSSDISFNFQMLGNDAFSGGLSRGPYLQIGGQTEITIRWRTTAAENSRVEVGTVYGTYPTVVTDASNVTEHIIRVTGLSIDTKYYYRIGNSTAMQLPDANQFFTTLPASNTTRKIRITAFGDCGRNSAAYQDNNLANYQNFLTTNGIEAPDAWILMGDNAYTTGSDAEFTNNFFNIYRNNLLKNHKMYPSPGNHDYGNNAANKALRNMAYHTNFSVPQTAQLGGVASNKQNYYSFDIGNIHFLSLDAYGTESDGTSMETAGSSALKTWLTADLAANTKKWTIAYWHHPPYTKSSHNSDSEGDLVNIRQNFITFLETRGVDLIICGHSHAYERGYLIKNYTGNWASFSTATHAVSTSSATYTSAATCPYVYNSAPANHGTVYVVAGSAGASGGTNAGFAAGPMPFAVNDAGILYFEVEDNRLDAKMLRQNGTVFDQFTIIKDVNKTTNYTITNGSSQILNASWPQSGNYTWTNTAGTTRSVTVTPPNSAITNYTVTDAFGCVTDQFSVTTNGTLPVHLSSYDVRLHESKVNVSWTTATETNNDFFTIERSANGIDFTAIGRVAGAGNSTVLKSYTYTDASPLPGVSYYRLSQTNIDAHTEYMGVKRVDNAGFKDFDVKALTGASNKLVLQINSTVQGQYKLTIFDIQGRKFKEESLNLGAGMTNKEISLKPGVYIWEISNAKGESLLQKAIVQ